MSSIEKKLVVLHVNTVQTNNRQCRTIQHVNMCRAVNTIQKYTCSIIIAKATRQSRIADFVAGSAI